MEELNKKILAWAEERGIDNPKTQLIKIMEEFGEVMEAGMARYSDSCTQDYLKELKDAIGDTYITVLIMLDIVGMKRSLDISSRDWYGAIESHREIARRIGSMAKDIAHDYNIIPILWEAHLNEIICHLHNIASKSGFTLTECVEVAYNDIKDRKGKTVNGNFIKEQ